jgi:mRNA-degrading endonuclease toxin of MazEF toxin-antitoxin module
MPMRAVIDGGAAADPRRGEIYEINLDPAKGREQKGRRVCLIVSTDALNVSGLGIAIACTMTTTHRPKFQWRPKLVPADLTVIDRTWRPETSWVQTDQVITVDTEEGRFLRHVATVAVPARMAEVTKWLRLMIGP